MNNGFVPLTKELLDDAEETYLELQGWIPCAYHGGRFLHSGEWKHGKWYEFMAQNGRVFKARMVTDAHMDCFNPPADVAEREVWFYREI